ncbi:MAG: DUF1636 domain-containing protein [Boseongicola sp. SB0676_bin_33]|nr:DUF1636 domain-containing protein [Boseongicola sp. SB0676_bin_33]MYK32563.1 DUF1636 domain-containing protein [Boseongicola sp. SB0670_bin_30]
MNRYHPIQSFCMTCRDGNEVVQRDVRGGSRLAQAILSCSGAGQHHEFGQRGLRCMSQCKRSCVASLSVSDRFSYMFGNLDAAEPGRVEALKDLSPPCLAAPEGFQRREARPYPLRERILGRLPQSGSSFGLVTKIEEMSACIVRT